MKTQYKPIAMRCTQEQFDSIKDKINLNINDIVNFEHYPYLVNLTWNRSIVSNIKNPLIGVITEIIETFDAEYFLDCCGREKSDVIFKGKDMQYRCLYRYGDKTVWKNCSDEVEYRLTPKPNLDADIEALQEKAKELGLKVTVIIE